MVGTSVLPTARASAALLERAPEYQPILEQLLCARAAFFIGNVASTFTATVVHERDLRAEHTRDSLYLWGNEDRRTVLQGVADGGRDASRSTTQEPSWSLLPVGTAIAVIVVCMHGWYHSAAAHTADSNEAHHVSSPAHDSNSSPVHGTHDTRHDAASAASTE